MVEAFDLIKIGFEIQKLLDHLDENGYFLFAGRSLQPMIRENPESEKWSVATIIIKKRKIQK